MEFVIIQLYIVIKLYNDYYYSDISLIKNKKMKSYCYRRIARISIRLRDGHHWDPLAKFIDSEEADLLRESSVHEATCNVCAAEINLGWMIDEAQFFCYLKIIQQDLYPDHIIHSLRQSN